MFDEGSLVQGWVEGRLRAIDLYRIRFFAIKLEQKVIFSLLSFIFSRGEN